MKLVKGQHVFLQKKWLTPSDKGRLYVSSNPVNGFGRIQIEDIKDPTYALHVNTSMLCEKFVLVSEKFGYDLFYSDDGGATDRVEEAMTFTCGEDNPVIKALFINVHTGDGYDFIARGI